MRSCADKNTELTDWQTGWLNDWMNDGRTGQKIIPAATRCVGYKKHLTFQQQTIIIIHIPKNIIYITYLILLEFLF